MRIIRFMAALAVTCSLWPSLLWAQSETTHWTMVVPTVPGGGLDLYARILASEFTKMGQLMVVENRPGGASNIGTNYVAKSAPSDRLLLMTGSAYAIFAAISKSQLSFDPDKDLAPLAYLGAQPFVIGVNAELPVKNLQELISLAKKPDSNLTYASCGYLTAQHLAGELLKSMAGVDLLHVPYAGCTPAATDVAGGQVQIGIIPFTAARAFMDSGRMRPLAQTGTKRLPLMPDIPTVSESGLPGYAVDQWWGVFAAANTPRETLEHLNADMRKVVGMADVNKTLLAQGIEPVVMTPDEFTIFLHADIERWSKLAAERGLKPGKL